MNTAKRILALLLVVFTMVGMLAACGGGGNQGGNQGGEQGGSQGGNQGGQNIESTGPKYGGHLNVHTMYDTSNIDYLKSQGVWGYVWSSCVYESVLTRDAEYNIQPGVCDYTLSEDKTVLTLWPREGRKFHNGDTVDVYDVEASVWRFLNNYSSAQSWVTPYLKSVEVVDGKVVVTFNEYREKTMYYIANGRPWCAVIPKEICEKYPKGTFTKVEDAIGTGPYKITNFVTGVRIEVEKFDDYVPMNEGMSGMAGPKYGYLDTISFLYNPEYSSSTNAMLSGEYDITDVIEEDYRAMAEKEGIYKHNLGDTNTGLFTLFNTKGTHNVCAKYPDLRRAIMAAIDWEELVEVYSDGGTVLGGSPIMLEKYNLDVFDKADYYGPANVDLAEQYLEKARAAGYKDEPVQMISNTNTASVEMMALLGAYLDDAGINYKKTSMESVAYTKFYSSPSNNWDFIIMYPLLGYTPATQHDAIRIHYWQNAQKDAILEKLETTPEGSDEYMQYWKEFAELMVEDCAVVFLGTTQWIWYHKNELHTNDEGMERYFYNAYWDNPEAHTK